MVMLLVVMFSVRFICSCAVYVSYLGAGDEGLFDCLDPALTGSSNGTDMTRLQPSRELEV
jgi:hypothetical protein